MKLLGLRSQRELRCWSVADLARVAGCTWPTAAHADGGGEVSAATARKMLLALEASPPSRTAMALMGEQVGVGASEERGDDGTKTGRGDRSTRSAA